jgi:hypothetical protein
MNLETLVRTFVQTSYVNDPNSRLQVNDIYEEFRVWIMGTLGVATMNAITRKQVYAILKTIPEYPYIRSREGYCLRGLSRKRIMIAVQPTYIGVSPILEPTYAAPINVIEAVLPEEVSCIDPVPEKHIKPARPIGLTVPRAFQVMKAQ